MTQQPEALRLAELCEGSANAGSSEPWTRRQAAAELRRLHAEKERLAGEVANRNRRALEGDEAVTALENVHAYYEKLERINAQLLEALRFIADRQDLMFAECSDAEKIIDVARAAIAAAKGEA